MIACFSALDGTALRNCKQFNSSYNWVQFYSTIAAGIGPLIAAATIKDAPKGSGGKIVLYLFWENISSKMLTLHCIFTFNFQKNFIVHSNSKLSNNNIFLSANTK